jgi:2-polyprenyl-3-methyl-5-hydroxy-6-metoxy-1,4-benzoquinol methylase
VSATPLAERTNSGLHESLLHRISAISRDTPVLDLGCGTGAWLDRLAGLGFTDLCGIDGEPTQFACSASRFVTADLDRDEPQLGGRTYGLISAIEVIEHLENPGHLWRLVGRHLTQDGQFLLTTPNIRSLNSRLRFLLTGELPFFDSKSDPTHLQPVYLDAAVRIMSRYGLRVEETWTYPALGSRVFRKGITRLTRLLGSVVADREPGDNLCVVVRRQPRAQSRP